MPILKCDIAALNELQRTILSYHVNSYVKAEFPNGYSLSVARNSFLNVVQEALQSLGADRERFLAELAFVREIGVVLCKNDFEPPLLPQLVEKEIDVVLVTPIVFQGGCYEDKLAEELRNKGHRVLLAVNQDVDPRRFSNKLVHTETISLGSKFIDDQVLRTLEEIMINSPNATFIFSRLWMVFDSRIANLLKERNIRFIPCDRGWFRYNILPSDQVEILNHATAISLMLPDHKKSLPIELQKKVHIHGLLPKHEKYLEASRVAGRFKIAFFGRISSEKCIDDLISSFLHLKTYFAENATLDIIGNGPQTVFIQALIEKFGLTGSVFFCGYSDHVIDTLKEYDMTVSMSRVEGIPNAVLESIQAGTGVIVRDEVPGHKWLVDDGITGILVEATGNKITDVIAFAQAMYDYGSSEVHDDWNESITSLKGRVGYDLTISAWFKTIDRFKILSKVSKKTATWFQSIKFLKHASDGQANLAPTVIEPAEFDERGYFLTEIDLTVDYQQQEKNRIPASVLMSGNEVSPKFWDLCKIYFREFSANRKNGASNKASEQAAGDRRKSVGVIEKLPFQLKGESSGIDLTEVNQYQMAHEKRGEKNRNGRLLDIVVDADFDRKHSSTFLHGVTLDSKSSIGWFLRYHHEWGLEFRLYEDYDKQGAEFGSFLVSCTDLPEGRIKIEVSVTNSEISLALNGETKKELNAEISTNPWEITILHVGQNRFAPQDFLKGRLYSLIVE